jgi:hypothetical protein
MLLKNCTFLWIIFISLWNQKVSKHAQVHIANGSPLHEEEGAAHICATHAVHFFVTHVAKNIHLQTVTNVFHMHMRSLTSPDPYIAFTNFPRQMKCAFITEDYTFQETFIIFHPV